MEATADNSVGNVTGSNSVNVFLGLGLPWSVAAVYHYVKSVSLLKSLSEYRCFKRYNYINYEYKKVVICC